MVASSPPPAVMEEVGSDLRRHATACLDPRPEHVPPCPRRVPVVGRAFAEASEQDRKESLVKTAEKVRAEGSGSWVVQDRMGLPQKMRGSALN